MWKTLKPRAGWLTKSQNQLAEKHSYAVLHWPTQIIASTWMKGEEQQEIYL